MVGSPEQTTCWLVEPPREMAVDGDNGVVVRVVGLREKVDEDGGGRLWHVVAVVLRWCW